METKDSLSKQTPELSPTTVTEQTPPYECGLH